MNSFFAVIVIFNHAPATNLFISGPWAEQACHEEVAGVTNDESLSKLVVTSGCIPESDLPKMAEIAKQHECVFAKRGELASGANIAVFNCPK